MTGQKARMLEMLKKGPVSNVEMAQACILNYTARISDLRRMGYDIRELRHGSEGTRWYELTRLSVENRTEP